MKIRTKIMIFFISATLIITAISLITAGYFGRETYDEKVSSENERALRALSSGLEMTIAHIQSSSDAVFWNSAVQDELTEMTEDGAEQAVYETITPLLLSDDAISSIVYLDQNGNCTYSLRSGVVVNEKVDLEQMAWYPDVIRADGDWIYETDSGGVISYTGGKSNVITMIRSLRNRYDYRVIGYLMINMDDEALRDTLNSFVGSDTSCYIFDGNACVFSLDGDDPSGAEKAAAGGASGIYTDDESGESRVVGNRSFGIQGWNLVTSTACRNGIFIDTKLFFITILFAVVSMIFCWIVVTRTVTDPLRDMTVQLKEGSAGSFVFPVSEEKNDELTTLKKAYNHMILSIDSLNEKNRRAEQALHEGEVRFLLSQMQPHFLYNTLDTISGMLLAGEPEQAYRLVQTLSVFYRESMQTGEETAEIEEEVDLTRNYIRILNMRYGDTIDADFEVDPSLLHVRMPRMILQPLVENSVHHGLRPRGTRGKLMIRVTEESGRIVVCVADDGVGMTEEEIDGVFHKSEQGRGFGMYAIRKRLYMMFDKDRSMKIESEKGKYTRVTVIFPEHADGKISRRDDRADYEMFCEKGASDGTADERV